MESFPTCTCLHLSHFWNDTAWYFPAVPNGDVKTALLLAHGVELPDSLAEDASYAAATGQYDLLGIALHSFISLRPLAERGIVAYVLEGPPIVPSLPPAPYFRALLHDGTEDPAFRRALADIAGLIEPDCTLESLRASAPKRRQDFERWFHKAMKETRLYGYVDDLQITLAAHRWSNASAWLPSRGHLRSARPACVGGSAHANGAGGCCGRGEARRG